MNETALVSSEPLIAAPEGTKIEFTAGFFFAFRLFIMLLSVRVLGTDPQTGVEATLALTGLLVAVVMFATLGQVRHSFGAMSRVPSVRWVLAFLFFSGCSLAWSNTASLPAALAFWCAMAADVFMVGLLLRAGRLDRVADSLMKGYVCGACAIALIAWIMPAQSDLRLGDEELLGPNQIGYLSAFAFFLAQLLIRRKAGRWGWAAALLGITLLRSLSKTTIAAFLVAQTYLLVQDKSITRRTKVAIAVTAVVVIGAFGGLLSSYYDVYTNAGNQAETLTGRLGIWAYFLQEALQRPWIGHGFHSVWKVIPPFGDFEARHAHNELLQQFYAYGIAGIILIAGLYGSFYRQIRRLPAGPFRAFFTSVLLFVLVRGLADTEAFDLSLPLWTILLFSSLVESARLSVVPRQAVQPGSGLRLADDDHEPQGFSSMPEAAVN